MVEFLRRSIVWKRLGDAMQVISGKCVAIALGLTLAGAGQAMPPAGSERASFDCYQVSLQARGCSVKVFINGQLNKHLSADAKESSVSSVPMGERELKRKNTVLIRVDEAAEDAYLDLNAEGINVDGEQIVDTSEPGHALAIHLTSAQLHQRKEFSASFEARLSRRYQVITDMAAVRAYAITLVKLFVAKDAERLAGQSLFVARREPSWEKLSTDDLKNAMAAEFRHLFERSTFMPVKDEDIWFSPSFGGIRYTLMAGDGVLLRFTNNADAKKRVYELPITVGQFDGAIRISRLR